MTTAEILDEVQKGNLAALTSFVENMQIQRRITIEEPAWKKILPDLDIIGRGVSKIYTVDDVDVNGYLWRSIYKRAAQYDHINLLDYLYRSSCILMDKMKVEYLVEILLFIADKAGTKATTHIFKKMGSIKNTYSRSPR